MLSWTDDASFVRVQFATLGRIEESILMYWPQSSSIRQATIVSGQDWIFTDGGEAKRKLYLHKIKTKLLEQNTLYHYRLGSRHKKKRIQWSKIYEFHTPTESRDDAFSFLATGDIGACNAVAASHLIDFGKTHQYDFITIAGDQAYNMDDFNGTKGDEYLNFMQEIFARVPYLGSTGNHEAAYNFSHYKNRFNSVPYAESKSENALMYSINYKSLHLISFSTEIFFTGSVEEQQTAYHWLENDLTLANQHRFERPWIIFMTHHPIYCSSQSPDCTIKADRLKYGDKASSISLSGINVDSKENGIDRGNRGLEQILLKHRVDIYMSGHVHNYERTYPVANGQPMSMTYHNAPSFFQIVIGNGGQPEGPEPFQSSSENIYYPEWSAKRYSGYGFSTFKVTPTSIIGSHYQANEDGSLGEIVDEFIVTKDPLIEISQQQTLGAKYPRRKDNLS
ncbi:Metallo-dependent phosphatase-like protein [Mycotypha africana]|uniref:Metallo-dependent phosphatase-like protein n=1 Tax=Mycotypha africana TaxID=64632 RepID=UPI0023006C8C|nr:Metallo-dependent phosphatase-like protein [Mycotypha africana]KAI8984776.1 Metallo-dependent phosphatase-like protein [Mycotypha africana]